MWTSAKIFIATKFLISGWLWRMCLNGKFQAAYTFLMTLYIGASMRVMSLSLNMYINMRSVSFSYRAIKQFVEKMLYHASHAPGRTRPLDPQVLLLCRPVCRRGKWIELLGRSGVTCFLKDLPCRYHSLIVSSVHFCLFHPLSFDVFRAPSVLLFSTLCAFLRALRQTLLWYRNDIQPRPRHLIWDHFCTDSSVEHYCLLIKAKLSKTPSVVNYLTFA